MDWSPGGFFQGSLGVLNVADPHGKKAGPRTVLLGLFQSCGTLAIENRLVAGPFTCIVRDGPRAVYPLIVLRRLLVHGALPWKEMPP